jgi:hypothetical protein
MRNLLVIGNLSFLMEKTSDLQAMIQDMIESGEVVEREELDQLLELKQAEVSKLLDAMAQLKISEDTEETHPRSGGMVAGQKNICFKYDGRPGSCYFGSSCKFLHQAKPRGGSGGQHRGQRGYHGGGGGGGRK